MNLASSSSFIFYTKLTLTYKFTSTPSLVSTLHFLKYFQPLPSTHPLALMAFIYCFLLFSKLLFILTTTLVVSALKLPIFHKSHPTVQHLFAPSVFTKDSYKANITFDREYHIHFSVGTPSFKTYAVFDTGSPMMWLQSSTCNRCWPLKDGSTTDLDKSTTLEKVFYDTNDCDYLGWTVTTFMVEFSTCDGCCGYQIAYEDRSNSTGHVVTDYVTFIHRRSLIIIYTYELYTAVYPDI